jgi:hypothetical protein
MCIGLPSKEVPTRPRSLLSSRVAGCRYSEYFTRVLRGVRPSPVPLVLKRVIMHQVPNFAGSKYHVLQCLSLHAVVSTTGRCRSPSTTLPAPLPPVRTRYTRTTPQTLPCLQSLSTPPLPRTKITHAMPKTLPTPHPTHNTHNRRQSISSRLEASPFPRCTSLRRGKGREAWVSALHPSVQG